MDRCPRISEQILFLMLLAALVTACGGGGVVRPAKLYQDFEGKQIKTAYIVKQDKSYRDIELHLQKALTEYGIASSIGVQANKYDAVDIYVTVQDTWVWDMAMYLSSLNISFYENSSRTLLASGKFETFGMHGYPDAEKVTKDVVRSILDKLNFKKTTISGIEPRR